MNDILQFLVRYCSFLWEEAHYRITDSEVSTNSGGDALLVISSDALRMRFVRDRGQLFLDFQPASSGSKAKWYSIDLLYRLITEQRRESAELDAEYAMFFRSSLRRIEQLFGDSTGWIDTKRRLEELQRLRAKEMFG